MVSRTTSQIKHIKEQFTERISAVGYERVASSALRGYETLTFKKIVSEYLFFVYLYFQPPTGKLGEGKLFGVSISIDLLEGFSLRNPQVQKGDDFESLCCPFSIQSFFQWDKIDLELANRQRANPYSVREKWSIGANLCETKAICNDVLDFPLQWIKKYEELFQFPSPLDLITIQSLYDARDSEVCTDLLQGIGAQPEKLAQVLLYFYKKSEDHGMISSLQEFLHGQKRIMN